MYCNTTRCNVSSKLKPFRIITHEKQVHVLVQDKTDVFDDQMIISLPIQMVLNSGILD